MTEEHEKLKNHTEILDQDFEEIKKKFGYLQNLFYDFFGRTWEEMKRENQVNRFLPYFKMNSKVANVFDLETNTCTYKEINDLLNGVSNPALFSLPDNQYLYMEDILQA